MQVSSDEVAPFHMAVDVDEEKKQLFFRFKLVAGLCPDSQGRNVAKLANLPEKVVEEAQRKSEEWRQQHASQGPELLVQEILKMAEAKDTEGLKRLYRNRKDWARCL